MTRNTRITEELSWNSLKDQFYIGNRTVEELKKDAKGKVVLHEGSPIVVKTTRSINELQDAIDDGTLDEMVKNSADKFHNGNVEAVYAAMARNVSSTRCNLAKRSYAPNREIDIVRLDTLAKFIADRRGLRSPSTIPQWAYGPEEIDEIDDPAVLQKIINSISDVCSDKAFGKYSERLGENYVEVAKANRKYARERKAAIEAKANQVDPDILDKLASGGKVTLTADQAALLAKLLGNK